MNTHYSKILEFKETHLHRINSMYIFDISFYEIAIALELLTTLIMSGIEYSKETQILRYMKIKFRHNC